MPIEDVRHHIQRVHADESALTRHAHACEHHRP
jgi:hypothetical protein